MSTVEPPKPRKPRAKAPKAEKPAKAPKAKAPRAKKPKAEKEKKARPRRKKSKHPARIFSFGAKPPVTELAAVERQMLLGHRYKNELVALERARREARDEAARRHFPELVQAEADLTAANIEVEAARNAIKNRNSRARAKTQTPEDRARVRELTERRTALGREVARLKADAYGPAEVKKARKAWLTALDKERPAEEIAALKADLDAKRAAWFERVPRAVPLTADLDALAVAHNDRKKRIRAGFAAQGLYWGTYGVVDQSMNKAQSGPPPQFKSWRGDGKIGLQVQRDPTVTDVLAGRHRFVQIDPPPPLPEGHSKRQEKTRRTVCRIRIGSTGRRGLTPVWATVPFTMHREMPADATVKWCYLFRERIGTREEWRVQFVLAREGGFPKLKPSAATGTVGVDVGWRRVPEGLRVAYWVGSDGREGQLILPARRLDAWPHVEELQGVRDRNFDGAREVLARWLEGDPLLPDWVGLHIAKLEADLRRTDLREGVRPALEQEVAVYRTYAARALTGNWLVPQPPEWFVEKTARLRQWRSANRLAAVVRRWRNERFVGDEVIFNLMEEWRRRDRHVYDWMESRRKRNVRWRNDAYRAFASELRQRYRTAHLENVNWAELQKNLPPEMDPAGVPADWRKAAAVGTLLAFIKEAAPVSVMIPAAHTTDGCHVCGHIEDFDRLELVRTCPKCKAVWDQDKNAAVNLLRGGAAAPPAA
jgi:hypothetical protein